MAENEEVKQETNEEIQDEVVEQTTPDPVEDQAREYGWASKEEFDAEPKNAGKKWRSAEEFMDRKSFFDKIEAQSHEIKNLKKGMQQFGAHYANVEKAAYKKALDDLKAQRLVLIEEGEHVKAEKILDRIDEVKEKMNQVQPPVQVEDGPSPEFMAWKDRNDWYKRDDAMTRYADSIGKDMHDAGETPERILKVVEKKVREVFPQKFRNPNRDTAPEVVGSGKRSGAPASAGARLNAQQERILSSMIASGAPITREQYIKDLKAMGEI